MPRSVWSAEVRTHTLFISAATGWETVWHSCKTPCLGERRSYRFLGACWKGFANSGGTTKTSVISAPAWVRRPCALLSASNTTDRPLLRGFPEPVFRRPSANPSTSSPVTKSPVFVRFFGRLPVRGSPLLPSKTEFRDSLSGEFQSKIKDGRFGEEDVFGAEGQAVICREQALGGKGKAEAQRKGGSPWKSMCRSWTQN